LEIEVELFGQLDATRQGKRSIEVNDRSTARQVAELLKVEPGLIGLVTINGVQQKLDASLTPGCRLCFFPPMSGG
jgi:molybdopterin converting factor small subunit